MESAVAYYRVSTRHSSAQGSYRGATRDRSALAEAERITIIAEFVEAETGKGADALDRRPQLAAALAAPRPPNAASWSQSSTGCRAMLPSWPA